MKSGLRLDANYIILLCIRHNIIMYTATDERALFSAAVLGVLSARKSYGNRRRVYGPACLRSSGRPMDGGGHHRTRRRPSVLRRYIHRRGVDDFARFLHCRPRALPSADFPLPDRRRRNLFAGCRDGAMIYVVGSRSERVRCTGGDLLAARGRGLSGGV